MDKRKILATAHAGCMDTRYGSLDSITAGIAAGADVVEVDVRFTENEIPVLSHDAFHPEQAGSLVRLEEALRLLQGYPDIFLNLDMKEITGIKQVVRLLQEAGLQRRAFFTGLEPDAAAEVQKGGTGIPYLLNYKPDFSRIRDIGYINELVHMVESLDAFGLNLQYQFAGRELVEAFHKAGKKVCVWTVDREEEMRKMAGLGVDSITSRRVDLLVRTVREPQQY